MAAENEDFMQNHDPKLELIALNARLFGVELGQNKELMKMLLTPSDFGIKAQDLAKASEIFETLEKIKENSQMSKN